MLGEKYTLKMHENEREVVLWALIFWRLTTNGQDIGLMWIRVLYWSYAEYIGLMCLYGLFYLFIVIILQISG